MKIIRHQISFFTPEAVYGNMAKALSILLSRSGSVLDAPPTAIPVPADAPPDIPRIILRSVQGDKELTVRLDRIDCGFARSYSEGILAAELTGFQQDVLDWILPLLTDLSIQVNRIGVVFQRATSVSANPAIYLAQRFCREEYMVQPFGNTKRFEIHNLKNYTYVGVDINSWVRVQTLTDLETGQDLVSVVNDLNHIQSDNILTHEHVRDFIVSSVDESQNILALYNIESGEA